MFLAFFTYVSRVFFKQEMEKADIRNEAIRLLDQEIMRLVQDLLRKMTLVNRIGLNFWDQLTLTLLSQQPDRPAVLVAPTSVGLKMSRGVGHSEVFIQVRKT